MADRICAVGSCDQPVKALGWCRRHYWYAWKHGVPEKPTWEELFWSHVDKNGPVPVHRPELGPCWLWTGHLTDRGYGVFRRGSKVEKAHRVAYEILVGPIPEGTEPDHLCRIRACVHADRHVEAVTHVENCRRGADARLAHVDPDEVERLWRAGHGKRAIGALLGCSWGPVVRIAKERGLPAHPAGGRRRR